MNDIITIVIPVYNREKIVERTLDSVSAQSFRPLKVIVVDNGSSDGSLDVVRRWSGSVAAPDFEVTVLEEPELGACRARNLGLEMTVTPWVMFFDSDDVMSPEHVERVVRTIRGNPDADVVGWNVRYHDLRGSVSVKSFYDSDPLYNNIFHASLATQRYCVRTELLRGVGGWNEDVPVWNDIELGSRLLMLTSRLVTMAGEVTVDVHVCADSITGPCFSRNGRDREHALDVIERDLPAEYRHWVDLKRVILASLYTREGSPDGRRLLDEVMGRTEHAFRRMLWRTAYLYTSHGGRGIARIMRRFL